MHAGTSTASGRSSEGSPLKEARPPGREEPGVGAAGAGGPWSGGRAGRWTEGQGHLARLLVHVEGATVCLGDPRPERLHQVLGQPVGQVGLKLKRWGPRGRGSRRCLSSRPM